MRGPIQPVDGAPAAVSRLQGHCQHLWQTVPRCQLFLICSRR